MSPQLVVNPSDVGKALGLLSKLSAGNPIAIPARLMGIGAEEQKAGVPTWAWVVLAFGAGAVVSAAYWPTLRDRFR